jgi:hypothetical protein
MGPGGIFNIHPTGPSQYINRFLCRPLNPLIPPLLPTATRIHTQAHHRGPCTPLEKLCSVESQCPCILWERYQCILFDFSLPSAMMRFCIFERIYRILFGCSDPTHLDICHTVKICFCLRVYACYTSIVLDLLKEALKRPLSPPVVKL